MVDTILYDLSIPAISGLQTSLSSQAPLMQLMSVVFDPKYAFLVYSPIAYLLDRRVGQRLIMTTVLAEWLNMVLKWLLHGERPYWYVHSSGHFDPQQTPIRQFPITCELGPGHPSGHAMVTAAVWYIILDALLSRYNLYQSEKKNKPIDSNMDVRPDLVQPAQRVSNQNHSSGMTTSSLSSSSSSSSSSTTTTTPATAQIATTNNDTHIVSSSRQADLSVWTFYVLLLISVSVSRVFLGCHFPHQCLAGAILGLLLARWVARQETKAVHFVAASAVLFSTVFAVYGLLQALGFDPAWTIKLATKHCEKREYIHLDTAPFFSIMRYCGYALGTGIGLSLPLRDTLANTKAQSKPAWFSARILMAMLMARLVDNLALFVSHANLSLFYSAAFCAYTLFSYAFIQI